MNFDLKGLYVHVKFRYQFVLQFAYTPEASITYMPSQQYSPKGVSLIIGELIGIKLKATAC